MSAEPNRSREKQIRKIITLYITMVCVFAAASGLLFGLDQGFVNGALKFISQEFSLTATQGGEFVATMAWGSVIGALCSGALSSRLGRKWTLVFTALVFLAAASVSSLSKVITLLTICRFIIGWAVGVASMVAPLYLSEIAPPRFRGALISIYQFLITLGIFIIYTTNSFFSCYSHSWRLMYLPIIIVAAIMFIGCLFIPRTSRWLLLKNRVSEAYETLYRTRYDLNLIEEEVQLIQGTVAKHKNESLLKNILKPMFGKALVVALCIQLLQQFSGINAIIYYSTSIFSQAGMHSSSTATVVVGLVNMLSAILAVLFVDKLGRKPILYIGLIIMLLALLVAGGIFHMKICEANLPSQCKIILLLAVLLYIFAFAISLGPITWIIASEIFPLKTRDVGMTCAILVNWISVGVIARFSGPIISSEGALGATKLFFFFAACCLAGLFFVRFFVPETKGVPLEQIEKNLSIGRRMRHIGR